MKKMRDIQFRLLWFMDLLQVLFIVLWEITFKSYVIKLDVLGVAIWKSNIGPLAEKRTLHAFDLLGK